MQNLDQNRIIAGRYRLAQSLGRGSFGEVYFAEDIQFNPPRAVALKLLHAQYVSDEQVRADLAREASVLARFDHPNILRVIDFGVSAEVAFIVTDLALGGSLARKLRPDPTRPPLLMPFAEVVTYVDQIAEALDEAHAQGLVHRDIKPQNILLDRRGRPMLADFGLATAVSGTSSSVMIDTSTSGTPLYMAPEQWQGRAGRSSDIYALGAVIYQMITGFPPFLGNQYELMGQHLNSPVPRLSERAPDLQYPPGLDQVIAAAMAKDPHVRIRPAKELALRLRRAINPEPIMATEFDMPLIKRPDPAPPNSIAGSLPPQISQSGSAGINPAYFDHETQNIRSGLQPDSNNQPTRAINSPAAGLPVVASNNLNLRPSLPQPTLMHEPVTPVKKRSVGLLVGLTLIVAAASAAIALLLLLGNNSTAQPTPTTQTLTTTQVAVTTGNPVTTADVATTAPVSTAPLTTPPLQTTLPPTTKPVTTVPPTTLAAFGSLVDTLSGHSNLVLSVAFSPDGLTLATASEDGTIKLWDNTASKKREKGTLSGHAGPVRSIAFSADSKLLASGSADKTVRIWDVASGKEILNLGEHQGPVTSVAFAPNGKSLASGSDDKTVKIWDLISAKSLRTLTNHTNYITWVAYSPDGKLLASGSADTTIKLWDVPTGTEINTLKGHTNWVWSVAFSPDGKTLASGSFDKSIKLWDVASGAEKATLSGYATGVRQVAFSPDGKLLASGSDDKTVKIWDLTTGQAKATFSGHSDIIYSVAFSADGKLLASGSADKTVRLWML